MNLMNMSDVKETNHSKKNPQNHHQIVQTPLSSTESFSVFQLVISFLINLISSYSKQLFSRAIKTLIGLFHRINFDMAVGKAQV